MPGRKMNAARRASAGSGVDRHPAMARAPSNFRQTDLAKAIKAATAAGVHILRIEIDKTGKISIITTNAADRACESVEGNEWDRV